MFEKTLLQAKCRDISTMHCFLEYVVHQKELGLISVFTLRLSFLSSEKVSSTELVQLCRSLILNIL